MNISTLNNGFYFNLPSDFVPESIEAKYMPLLKNYRKRYKSVIDYLNSTIQDISFPSLNFPTVSNPQVIKRKQINWKSVGNIYDMFDKNVTVTFLNADFNLNYMIILDILVNHYEDTNKPYDESLIKTILDKNRNATYHVQWRNVIFTGLNENKFAYNDQTIQTKNFTVTFTYNFMDIGFTLDGKDIISGNSFTN